MLVGAQVWLVADGCRALPVTGLHAGVYCRLAMLLNEPCCKVTLWPLWQAAAVHRLMIRHSAGTCASSAAAGTGLAA